MQELRDPHKLYENIKKSLVDEKQYYILLDEIQYVDRFHERIYPLSFSEYLSAYDGTEEDAWLEYMTYGGLPRILSMQTDEQNK